MSDINKLKFLLSCEGKLNHYVAKYCKFAVNMRNEKLKNLKYILISALIKVPPVMPVP